MEKNVKLSELLPFIEAAFDADKTFTLPITGTSMLPLLVQGRDTVKIKKPEFPLKAGELPLYRRADDSFVLHRIVNAADGIYDMCGDNQFVVEKNVPQSAIIGVVCEITRDGKTFASDDAQYIKYVEKMQRTLNTRYPLRQLKYRLYLLKNGKKKND